MRCEAPTLALHRLRLATRWPGRVLGFHQYGDHLPAVANWVSISRSDVHAAVKVHAVNTNRRVILDAQVDMFADAKPEVAGLGEIPPLQLVFLDLQPSL